MSVNLIQPKEARFQTWRIEEIFTDSPGQSGTLFIARVKDVIFGDDGIYEVSSVDATTNAATLELKMRYSNSMAFDNTNDSLITALSMYQPSAATRIFIDRSVTPATASVDERFRSHDPDATHVKVFLGVDVSADGIVVSEVYNAGGTMTTNEVSLEAPNPANPGALRPVTFNITRDIPNETLLTMVAYDATGKAIGKHPFLAELSAFIMPSGAATVYLESISLQSVLIDPADATRILNPINTPVDTSVFTVTLHYSDGSTTANLPIDGNLVKMHGISNFNTGAVGRPKEVVLSYYPGTNEPFIGGAGGAANHISKIYKLANVAVDTSFSLKLFPTFEYINAITGFQTTWYLANLERDLLVDVTANVVANDLNTGRTYSGNLMDVTQRVSLTLNTDDVIPNVYPGHVHTQVMDITLNTPGSVNPSPWAVDHILDGTMIFGVEETAHCSTTGDGSFNIGVDMSDKEKFLFELYHKTAPLFDDTVMITAPEPTHFIFMYEGVSVEVPIDNWNETTSMPAGSPVLVDEGTAEIKFIIRAGGEDNVVAIAPLMIRLDL